jgi:ubiquinone/menaquinone biosynthesis C-methylase UbiE
MRLNVEPVIRPRIAKRLGRFVLLLAGSALVFGCDASDPKTVRTAAAVERSATHYEFRDASRDGIGKFYMGREISQVMGHRGAAWLERPSRQQEERTDLLVQNLPLNADSIVADIGAGTGYFSFKIAERVPDGSVLAVDIQQEMLDIIELRKSNGAPGNVKTVLGAERDPHLPAAGVDLILLVDAYHEFSYPREMSEAMVRALRPGGRLVLIEYRGEDPSVAIKPLHKMTVEQAVAEMHAAGLEWERTESFLPQQHFLVFRRPGLERAAQ